MKLSIRTLRRFQPSLLLSLVLAGTPCLAQQKIAPSTSATSRRSVQSNLKAKPPFITIAFSRLTLSDIPLSGGEAEFRSRGLFPKQSPDRSPFVSYWSSGGPSEPPSFSSTSLSAATLATNEKPNERFHWKGALSQSLAFLAFEHAVRIAREPSTRKQLPGKWWEDYYDSVLGLEGWRDGDPFYVNYVGHPMQGAVSGYIQIQNDPHGKKLEFNDPGYWHSRSRAMAWSAAYSLQFELGPISESSIGNVGKGIDPRTGHTGAGAVDLVITPTVGTAWLVGEDIADRYLIRKLEAGTENRFLKSVYRGLLNPDRAMANMLAGRVPWHRETRGGVWRRKPDIEPRMKPEVDLVPHGNLAAETE